MADLETLDLQRAILGAATRATRALDTGRGVPTVAPLVAPGPNLFDGFAYAPSEAPQFATGYDSGAGLTTMAFTTDLSILTDGTSGDILTG